MPQIIDPPFIWHNFQWYDRTGAPVADLWAANRGSPGPIAGNLPASVVNGSPIKIMAGGDSITANQFANPDGTQTVCATNDSGCFCQGPALAGVNPQFVVYAQGGIGTQTWIDTYMTLAQASGAQIWAVLLGTNDINTMTDTVANTVAALWARLQIIYTAARAVGAYFIDRSIPPIGDDGVNHFSTQNKTSVISEINVLKKAYWDANPYWGEYVDTFRVFGDGTQYTANAWTPFKAGYSFDQIHPNNFGGFSESQLFQSVWTRLLPKVRLPESQGEYKGNDAGSAQIFSNPMGIGTAGSQAGAAPLTGNVITGLTVYNDDAQITGTTSIAAANSGIGNKQVISITVAGAPSLAAPKNIYVFSGSMAAQAVAGHRYKAAFRLKIVTSTSMLTKSIFRLNNSGAESLQWGNQTYSDPNTQLLPTTLDYEGIVTLTKTFSSIAGLFFNWQFYFGATGTVTIEIERIAVYDMGVP